MFSERLLAIFEMMATRERSSDGHGLLCTVAAEITAVKSSGIALTNEMLMTRFCASNAMARSLIDAEVTFGEGPGIRAVEINDVVAVADLLAVPAGEWMAYTPAALALGARSVYALPVRIGVIRVGVLCLYHDEPLALSDAQSTDALIMASVVGRGIIALQAGANSHGLSEELQNEAAFDFTVHQAAGMVAVQAAVPIASALVALRMHAFAQSQSLATIATRVVARQLRFDAGLQRWIESR